MKYLYLFGVWMPILVCCINPKQTEKEVAVERAKLTPAENKDWVAQKLDSVMLQQSFNASNGMTMPYRLFLPKGFNKSESLPLLVYLHGRGERGSDNRSKMIDNIPLFAGQRSIVSPNMQAQFRSIVLVPQCSDTTINEEWAKWVGNAPETPWLGLGEDGSYTMAETPSASGFAALELIQSIVSSHHVNEKRVYLTGISMGGFGTWEFLGRAPELFAAAIPMAGYSDPTIVPSIKHLPIWIFHGDQDQYNPVQGSRNMYKLLKQEGSMVRYDEYKNTEHTPTFHKAWNNPAILPWLFAQSK